MTHGEFDTLSVFRLLIDDDIHHMCSSVSGRRNAVQHMGPLISGLVLSILLQAAAVADALQSGNAPAAASGLAALSGVPDAASLLQQILNQVPFHVTCFCLSLGPPLFAPGSRSMSSSGSKLRPALLKSWSRCQPIAVTAACTAVWNTILPEAPGASASICTRTAVTRPLCELRRAHA